MAGARLPQGTGQGGGQRYPPTAGEGSGGFRQQQEGKSSKTATSSVPKPPRGPHHLAEKGAHVLGKLKIDLRLLSHWPQAGSGITGMNVMPPSAPTTRHPGDRLPLLPHASSPLIPGGAVQGTCSRQPSKGSSSQPETLPLRSPRLPWQLQCQPLLCLHPAQLQLSGMATLCATGSLWRERPCLGDMP